MKHKVVLGVFTFKGEFPGKKSDMMVSMWRRKDFNLAADFWVEFDLPDNLDYIGESISEFEIPYKKFKGTTRQFFLDAPDHENWQEIKGKYAATVPHVMVYPSDGNMKVSQIRKVQINNRHFKP